MKSGWLKTSAGTNMGPQNNTYLSASGLPKAVKEVKSNVMKIQKDLKSLKALTEDIRTDTQRN